MSDHPSKPQPSYYPSRKVKIPKDAIGQRLDNFLLFMLKGVPKSRIYKIVRKGEVRVNGGRKKPEYKLQEGDEVRIPPIRLDEKEDVSVPKRVFDDLVNRILFENDAFILINKPAGLAVHAGSGVKYGVIEALKQHFGTERPDLVGRLELVHRLDRGTSGCLLVAKSRQTLNVLQDQFRTRSVKKSYLALLSGELKNAVTVDRPLQRRIIGGEQRVVIPTNAQIKGEPGQAKLAVSHFYPVKYLSVEGVPCTLCRVQIETGRTHQIRVHAQSLGFPLLGDSKYGEESILKELCLHAYQLEFDYDSQRHTYVAPVCNDQADFFAQICNQFIQSQ